MPIQYKYDIEKNLVRSYADGVVTSNDIFEYFKDIFEDKAIASGFVEVADLNDVTDFVISHSDINKIAMLAPKWKQKGHEATLFCTFNKKSEEVSSMMIPLFQKADLLLFICKSEEEFKSHFEVFR